MRVRVALALCAVLAAPLPALADDVTDQINEALAVYAKKDTATAIAALEAATSLLRQARADSWKLLMPPAPPGWTAEEAEVNASAAMLGVGTGASRKYTKGDDSVEVQILTDSPIVQGLAAVLSNPLVAAAAGRTVVIGGRRMTYMKDDNAYATLVANKVLVRVQGSSGVPEATLKTFVAALPFAEIEKAVR